MGGRHFAAADGLRFASALMVVGFHAGTCYAIAPSTLSAAALRGLDMPTGGVGWTWWEWVGVELFFTLSGFVIAASAIGSTSAGFLRRRALRLYPAAWIAATITLALFALSQAAPVALLVPRWIAAVLLLPTGPWIDASYWTLAIECSFYLLIAAVLHRRSDGAAIERVGAALTLWSGCFWAVYVLRNPMGDALMHVRLIELLLLPAGAQFGLGIAIWALLHREVTARRIAAAIGAYGVSCVGVICHAADRAAAMHLKNDVAVPLLVFTLGVVVLLSARQLQPRFAAPAVSRWMAHGAGDLSPLPAPPGWRCAAVFHPRGVWRAGLGRPVAGAGGHPADRLRDCTKRRAMAAPRPAGPPDRSRHHRRDGTPPCVHVSRPGAAASATGMAAGTQAERFVRLNHIARSCVNCASVRRCLMGAAGRRERARGNCV